MPYISVIVDQLTWGHWPFVKFNVDGQTRHTLLETFPVKNKTGKENERRATKGLKDTIKRVAIISYMLAMFN